MSVELKIKSKSLTEESRIIRKEERKLLKTVRWHIARHRETGSNDEYAIHSDTSFMTRKRLEKHRKFDVRNESRATHIARAFIAGLPYKVVENKVNDVESFNKYILPRVVKMILKYGEVDAEDRQWDKTSYVPTDELKAKVKNWLEA